MNRAFISLYFFLVSSILLIGWGLNHVWTSFAPEDELHKEEIQFLFYWIEKNIQQNPDQFLPQEVPTSNLQLELISIDEIAGVEALQTLHRGEILAARTNNQLLWYKRIAETNQVIMLSKSVEQESLLYKILLLLFYLALALVIYLWVWPLSRDAKKLELQTQSLGPEKLPEELHLSNRSTLYPLAKAFNQMLQRLHELIASYKEMTNAVSHELRTPLARMKFALALIDETKLDNNAQQQLTSLSVDIHEMESLINTLLLYAGFEQKNQALKLKPGRIGDLLDSVSAAFKRAHPGGVNLIIEDLSAHQEFIAEWKLIETVLQNLLNNAARYAKTTICIKTGIDAKGYWISVDDDGPGIPEAERERVFDSFVRLYDDPNKPTYNSGFGLGLAIVKRIMQWHQGQVNIESSVLLGGARFVLHWPRAASATKSNNN